MELQGCYMTKIVELECSCGEVKGNVQIVPKSFFHVHCLCCDCQNFASHLGNADKILDAHGGSELLQTYPQYMEITEGKEKIACMQLKVKGIFRWYTSCCDMPLANTMNSAKVPFVGVPVKLMKFSSEQEKLEKLGPVIMKAFGKYSIGEMPKDAHERFPLSFMPKIMGFMIKGLINKRNSPSPFFNGKEPVTKVNTLN